MYEIETKEIKNMIYEIRGKEVMLDSDLAELYQCKNGTKSINLAVKRHINRFPERFMFRLTNDEYYKVLRSQLGTLELKRGEYSKYLPYVFTEQGVAMLSSVLRTEVAEKVSIAIMDAFVEMRKYINTNLVELKYINTMLLKHDEEIKLLQDTFKDFKPKINHIFFEGKIYDAYSLLLSIFESVEKSVIIIDNYANKELLDILSKTEKQIKVYSKNMDAELIKKYKSQYDNVEIIYNDSFHDRFIIIDGKELYHSGASFKDIGKKCFAISKIEDRFLLKELLSYISRR